jgi:secreted PhoX family phosphatase
MTHAFSSRGFNRRTLLRSGAAVASASALAGPLFGLFARQVQATTQLEAIKSPYGPIAPVRDKSTGLPLLQLPGGFSYQSFGWSGDPMADGKPTPMQHDGMAVVQTRVVDGETEITLIRNHESDVLAKVGLIDAPAQYDTAEVTYEDNTGKLSGGNTKLVFRGDRWVGASAALGGTLYNCAGGPTVWGSWLSCEEDKPDFSDVGGRKHGYVFEVAAEAGLTTGMPIVGMGRFDHEAVALDPNTGIIYLTEDDQNQSGLYRFLPNDVSRRVGALEQGGVLQVAKVAGENGVDLLEPRIGDRFPVEWVAIDDPDLAPQPYTEAPHEAGNMASGPFVQGRDKGGIRFSRLEGCWYNPADGQIYFVDTSAGRDEEQQIGHGEGAVWALNPARDVLTCIFASGNPLAGNNPDNLTVSPRGGILLCEDGGGVEDAFGFGDRLLGLTPAGETFIFAKNNVMLEPDDIQQAGKSREFIEPGDFREREWAGATFDPSGEILFVNIQDPGITFAITGPWRDGTL